MGVKDGQRVRLTVRFVPLPPLVVDAGPSDVCELVYAPADAHDVPVLPCKGSYKKSTEMLQGPREPRHQLRGGRQPQSSPFHAQLLGAVQVTRRAEALSCSI